MVQMRLPDALRKRLSSSLHINIKTKTIHNLYIQSSLVEKDTCTQNSSLSRLVLTMSLRSCGCVSSC